MIFRCLNKPASLLASLLIALLVSPALSAPKATIVGAKHLDAGEIEPGEVLHYKFTLRNDGDEILAIEDLEPTCYCTTAKTDLWDIPPGKSATISVRIDPSDFVGDVNKGVEITTNDPNNELLLLDIDINVRPGIAVLPPELDFGSVPPKGTRSQSVDIKVARSREFEVTKVISDVPYLETAYEPLELEERYGSTIYVKVMPGAPSGPFEAQVRVHTTDKARPIILIPVRGRGPGGLVATPGRVTFEMKSGGDLVGSFEVSGSLKIRVESSSKMLLAELTELKDGKHKVTLRLANNARKGRLLAKVMVSSLGDANGNTVSVPVMGIVR